MPPTTVGVIDVGSTSVHLLVADVSGHEVLALADESVFLGLGERVEAAIHLGPELRATLSETLVAYAARAGELGAATVLVVATEPLRRAADAARAVSDLVSAGGPVVHVLSHEEEALLTLLGVTNGRLVRTDLTIVDIGGGSTEIINVGPGRAVSISGLRVGAARLTAACVRADPPTAAEIGALRAEADLALGAAPSTMAGELIGVGGTASNLLKVIAGASADAVLTHAGLEAALAVLRSEPAASAAARLGLNPVRARLLPAGAAIVGAVLRRYSADRMRVVETGIR
ncbi:MAG: hypothetical protein ACHQNA_10450, partial [Acidimicrobiales bacterium]